LRLSRRLVPTVISFAVALVLVASSVAAAREPSTGIAATGNGSLALQGRAAAVFGIPSDVHLVYTWRDAAHGLTYERYQQFAAPYNAHVVGGQLTVVRRAGNMVLVTGAHFPTVRVTNRLLIDGKAAIARAVASRTTLADTPSSTGATLQSTAQLRVDPTTGLLSQRVESGAPGIHVIHDIDAETGAVIDGWNLIEQVTPGMGTGVKGDRKSLLGANSIDPADNITSQVSGVWRLQSTDGRVITYDAKKSNNYYSGISVMTDNQKTGWGNDNDWAAPYERAAVDAQYYANLTDDFYRDPSNVGGYDYTAPCTGGANYGPVRVVVHYDQYPSDGFGYANAFWDSWAGGHFVFGDGDGLTVGVLSGGQDIVSHEMTHRVTECRTPDLAQNYWAVPGALNEAFSDIMASAMEWKFNEPTSSGCRLEPGQTGCPDWWEGEDGVIGGSDFGFRNLADPESAGQPGHFDDKYNGSQDNAGVHINSTIASHAFYLTANGGRNARCSGPTDPQADCDIVVPAITLADATQIFFAAWGLLTENATFCEAHDRTVDAAELLFPGSDLHRAAAELAWAAVGRGQEDCSGSLSATDFSVSVAGRSIALAPGGNGQLAVTLTRGSSMSDNVDYAVTEMTPADASLTPENSATPGADDSAVLGISVPADMADGVYPMIISATDGSVTHYASAVLVVDSAAPTVGISSVDLPTSGQVGATGAVLLKIIWSASDTESGVETAALKGNGNTISSTGSHGGAVNLLAGGSAYSFQVTATDGVGNSAASDPSDWTVGRFQEGAATYSGSWTTASSSQSWGGAVRYATAHGASATFNFNGTDVAWITTRGTNRGKAKIYLDGALMTKVDLYSTATASQLVRRIMFAATGLVDGPHTLKIVVAGTSGRPRVDIDGFVTLGQ
jgi:bacillolysin